MFLADTRTLAFVAHLMAVSMAAVFALAIRDHRGTQGPVAIWAAAFAAKAIGLFALHLPASVPSTVSNLVGNVFTMVAAQLFLSGILVFLGRPPRWGRQGIFASIATLLSTIVWYVAPPAAFDAAVVLVVLCIQPLTGVVLLQARRSGTRVAPGLAIAAIAVNTAVLVTRLFRLGLAPVDSSNATLLMADVYYLDVILGGMLMGVGLLAMLYQKAHAGQLQTIRELQGALAEVRTLEGLLPICAWCKRIRDADGGSWHPVEHYRASRGPKPLPQAICPDCAARFGHEEPPVGR